MQLGLNHESQDTTKYILSKMNPNKKKQKNKKEKHISPENDHSRPNNWFDEHMKDWDTLEMRDWLEF